MITLRLTIQGDYFGRKAFGSIQGVMQGIHTVGSILGPIFAGWIYDSRGSYQWAWLTLAMIVFLSIALSLALEPPKEQTPESNLFERQLDQFTSLAATRVTKINEPIASFLLDLCCRFDPTSHAVLNYASCAI